MARKVEGTDRGLDALVGLVILLAEVVIVFLALSALYSVAIDPPSSSTTDSLDIGLGIAVLGSLLAAGISTLVYLVRIAVGRRSFTAPLWGTILVSVAVIIGYLVMTNGG